MCCVGALSKNMIKGRRTQSSFESAIRFRISGNFHLKINCVSLIPLYLMLKLALNPI